jgi:nitrogen fixation protein FixH
MQNNSSEASKKYGKKVLISFILFFLFVILLLSGFAYIAIKTNPGVVVEQAYEKGLNYNATLEEAEKQAALGWNADVEYVSENGKSLTGNIIINLSDKNKKALSGAKVTLRVIRPSESGNDFVLQAIESGAGKYISKLEFKLKGNWQVDATIELDGNKLFKSAKIFVK